MINSKDDLKKYLEADEIARFGRRASFRDKLVAGKMWKFNILLRKEEFNCNCRKGFIKKILSLYYKIKRRNIAYKTGWFVEPNTVEKGFCIVHVGPVIISEYASIGKNCKVQAMVNIGANNGIKKAPQLGDNVYIGPGAKLFGDIKIGSNVAVGANAVVNKSFDEDGITIGGVPAKKISDHGSELMINKKLKELDYKIDTGVQ
ncbi:MAG: serine acetyltransferase [Clostridia bacterium]|nr:serine acetyltransferase [Clostridia bacterium]